MYKMRVSKNSGYHEKRQGEASHRQASQASLNAINSAMHAVLFAGPAMSVRCNAMRGAGVSMPVRKCERRLQMPRNKNYHNAFLQ